MTWHRYDKKKPPRDTILLGMWMRNRQPRIVGDISLFRRAEDRVTLVFDPDAAPREHMAEPPHFWTEYTHPDDFPPAPKTGFGHQESYVYAMHPNLIESAVNRIKNAGKGDA